MERRKRSLVHSSTYESVYVASSVMGGGGEASEDTMMNATRTLL